MAETTPKLMLAAVEPSADALGASLIRSLREQGAHAELIGCGGPLMAAEGFESAFDTSQFSVMGFTDVAKVLPAAWARSREMAAICAEQSVDVAVFVDGWSFSRLAAKRIRQRAPQTKIVKFAAPQVWASRPERVDFVRDHFDLVLTLLPFEPPFFERVGVEAVFVGNPNFEQVAATPRSGQAFREQHNLGNAPLLILLPGSRKGEVTRLLTPFAEAAKQTMAKVPGLKVAIAVAPAVRDFVTAQVANWSFDPVIVDAAGRFDAFAAADAALAASGTVTTELAITETPMVVAYRVDALTAFWAKQVLVTPYVSILNNYANEMVIPERLQQDCTPEQLSADLCRLFMDEEVRRKQLSAFRRLLPGLIGAGDASGIAAREVIRLLQGEDRIHLDSGAQGQGGNADSRAGMAPGITHRGNH